MRRRTLRVLPDAFTPPSCWTATSSHLQPRPFVHHTTCQVNDRSRPQKSHLAGVPRIRCHALAVAGPVPMLPYIAAACRDARERQGRLQVHIAAELGRGEAAVQRFEAGKHWPRDPDAMVAAYARDLDIQPIDIWQEALRRWQAER